MVHPVTPEQRVAGLVREHYGRLLALLAAPTRDIAAAEDALADAVERALRRWPADGVPDNPQGWLLTVARNRLRDRWRSHEHRMTVAMTENDDTAIEFDAAVGFDTGSDSIPDRRLELMLVCAHPAIAPNVRTPLMLQTVLGVDAETIARAFAVPAPAMAQRLVRAKRRIRATGIAFRLPERADLAERLPALTEAVYGAYAIDWQTPEAPADSLAGEALYLALLLADLLPDEPEVAGLAALLCLSEARRVARRTADGRFVPLDEQDTAQWDTTLNDRGEALLRRAHMAGRPGRFQWEAAIASAHCDRARTGRTDWSALRTLHVGLLSVAPSLGARVSLAAVESEISGAAAGLAILDAVDAEAASRFQPYWSTRAHLLSLTGPAHDAADAYRRAIELTSDTGMADYLRRRLDRLDGS